MSNAAELGALVYEAESAWAEDVTTFATHRIPVLDAVDASGLKHDKIDPNRVVQYLQEGTSWILGKQSGSFKTKIHATGHGSSTSGALTVDAIETFLSFVFGKVTASAASGTTASGGTATAPTTVASATFAPGSLCRVGAQNDGRGNGQGAAISTHAATTLNLLTGLDVAPTNGDVVYTGENLYIPETPTDASTACTGLRFALVTANYRYECHGCFPMSVKLSGTNPNGETPYWEIDWGVSWWRYSVAPAFPSVVASNQYNPAPNAGGTMFLNDVGTATRVKRTHRSLSIDITLGIVPLEGPGGVTPYQTIIGAKRVPSTIKVTWMEDSEAATASPALDGFFTGTTRKHMLVTLSPANGASLAIYFPNLCITGARPVQKADNKINRIACEAMAYTGPTTTSELTLSAMRVLYS